MLFLSYFICIGIFITHTLSVKLQYANESNIKNIKLEWFTFKMFMN